MKKPLLILIALAGLALTGVSALAATSRSFTVKGTLKLVSAKHVKSNGDGDYIVRGSVRSAKLGHGTATYVSTIRNGVVKGTVVTKFKRGTIKTSMHGHFTLAPKGNVLGRTTGTGRITGGTGLYAGVSGSFHFIGISHSGGVTDMTLKGHVTPPSH